MNDLVTVAWLHHNIKDKNLIILDASIESTADGKQSENAQITVPNARYFDLKNDFSDKQSSYPNTLPSAAEFSSKCRRLGINQTSKIVVFDNLGVYSSPRVWWMFKTMGHEKVSVLNGGLPEWIRNGYPVNKRIMINYDIGDFEARPKNQQVISYENILTNINDGKFTLIDARSKGRFDGVEQESRKGLKSGHIPNSINIPFTKVIEGHKFKSKEKLKQIFIEKNLKSSEIVFSCGSGLTACIVMLAHEIAFSNNKLLFDGSWTEYAERQNLKEH